MYKYIFPNTHTHTHIIQIIQSERAQSFRFVLFPYKPYAYRFVCLYTKIIKPTFSSFSTDVIFIGRILQDPKDPEGRCANKNPKIWYKN